MRKERPEVALSTRFKNALLGTLGRVTRRHALLLPREARDEDSILSVRAPYRVEGDELRLEIGEDGPGKLHATLLGYEGHFPTRECWRGEADYAGPSTLTFDLKTGQARCDGAILGQVPLPLAGRRFCWRLQLARPDGAILSRTTGHYLPGGNGSVDAGYFLGNNYVDYEAQSASDHAIVIDLLRESHARGPVLEVGCATGGFLAALHQAGFAGVGLDVSAWAVQQAAARLGPNRAHVCDLERDAIPEPIRAQTPFGVLLLWFVFEHFADPFAALAKLTPLAGPGATLVLGTTNADSLTHLLQGKEWEGYFDPTHHGVDQASVRSLREGLPRHGWRIEKLSTHLIWDTNADPTCATLRDWYASDARFRRLLAERDLGDLITCVATKQA
jgi:SAM-dependent methyltransferase